MTMSDKDVIDKIRRSLDPDVRRWEHEEWKANLYAISSVKSGLSRKEVQAMDHSDEGAPKSSGVVPGLRDVLARRLSPQPRFGIGIRKKAT